MILSKYLLVILLPFTCIAPLTGAMATCGINNSNNNKKCVPCEGLDASAILPVEQVKLRLESSLPLWTLQPLASDHTESKMTMMISKSFVARDFQCALDSLNAMGAIAEREGHHPDFHLTGYRNVRVDLFTHSLGGITENDLTVAELLDQVPVSFSPKWLKENPQAAGQAKAHKAST